MKSGSYCPTIVENPLKSHCLAYIVCLILSKQVFSLFLEILPDFVSTYKEHIEDWLYVLMTQLLKKMGADLLGSVQAKVVKAMNTTR